jgi:type IV pilus assembly protein PilC
MLRHRRRRLLHIRLHAQALGALQIAVDRLLLRLPVFGDIVRKATIARWARTLSTMFAAGVPLVEALDSVGGAAGNHVYKMATKQIQGEVSTGTSLTVAMQNTNLFPVMVIQMVAIGEESGQLDSMLSKGRRLLRAGGR